MESEMCLKITYWTIIHDFSSSTYLLNYVYVSIVLKKYVAMFIFGCGIGNVRIKDTRMFIYKMTKMRAIAVEGHRV